MRWRRRSAEHEERWNVYMKRIEVTNEPQPADRNFRPPKWLLEEKRGWSGEGAFHEETCAPTFVPGHTIRTFDERGLFPEAMQRSYSLRQAILNAADDGKLYGVEGEVSREIELKTGRTPEGFYVPNFAFRTDLAAGSGPTASSGTAGQSFVPLLIEPS